jgi:cyclic pyranopterin phosphate synthase
MTLTHLDSDGRPKMVDVSEKAVTRRKASAAGYLELGRECAEALENGAGFHKGDPWSLARIAAISGVKHTSHLLPLAHPLPLEAVSIDQHWDALNRRAWLFVEASCESRTGVEMEAIVGVSVGLAGLYDALKAISHEMTLGPIKLLKKEGGRRGTIVAPWPECPWQM